MRRDGTTATLSNGALEVTFDSREGHIRLARLANRLSGVDSTLQGELFELKRRDGAFCAQATSLRQHPFAALSSPAQRAAREAARRAVKALEGTLVQPGGGLSITWRASIGDDGPYVRETFLLTTTGDVDLAGVSLISLRLPGASVAGTADGTPIVSGDAFFAVEHPMARANVSNGAATSTLQRALPLRAGVPVAYSAVIGVAASGSCVDRLRRISKPSARTHFGPFCITTRGTTLATSAATQKRRR